LQYYGKDSYKKDDYYGKDKKDEYYGKDSYGKDSYKKDEYYGKDQVNTAPRCDPQTHLKRTSSPCSNRHQELCVFVRNPDPHY
jgi:hypothetical protein